MGRTFQHTIDLGNRLLFQLTRPVWGEPRFSRVRAIKLLFQLTRPVWGEPDVQRSVFDRSSISTHSPRVGRTLHSSLHRHLCSHFNSLAPCGANPCGNRACFKKSIFQLTRPVWGEPHRKGYLHLPLPFQLTRPVWGEPYVARYTTKKMFISTHSPRVGRTPLPLDKYFILSDFNSLAPCGANPWYCSKQGA